MPTGIDAITLPVWAEIAYTLALYRPASQRIFPSGLTPPMSGVPGMRHRAITRRRAKPITVTAPPARLVTYRFRVLRDTYSPWASSGVRMNRMTRRLWASISWTPLAPRLGRKRLAT